MNEIEKKYFDAFQFAMSDKVEHVDDESGYIRIQYERGLCELYAQYPVDIYIVDFLLDTYDPIMPKYIIEIDGHEYHKTKQQRHNDYERERFLQQKGYRIIRFTGSEVFVNPRKCVYETIQIILKDFDRVCSYLYRDAS